MSRRTTGLVKGQVEIPELPIWKKKPKLSMILMKLGISIEKVGYLVNKTNY